MSSSTTRRGGLERSALHRRDTARSHICWRKCSSRRPAIDIVHVPYKGPAPAITDLLAGQVQVYFETAPLILPQAEAGKLRVIAVAGTSRLSGLKDVPTMIESGFPHLTGGFWAGILAPAGTPRPVVELLNASINDAMRSPDAQLGLAKLGGEAKLGSPEDFAAFIAKETEKWSAVIATAGLKIE